MAQSPLVDIMAKVQKIVWDTNIMMWRVKSHMCLIHLGEKSRKAQTLLWIMLYVLKQFDVA